MALEHHTCHVDKQLKSLNLINLGRGLIANIRCEISQRLRNVAIASIELIVFILRCMGVKRHCSQSFSRLAGI